MTRHARNAPIVLIHDFSVPQMYDERDQPSVAATEMRVRDLRETAIVRARYLSASQETVEYWDVFVKGELVRRALNQSDLPAFLARYGLRLPVGKGR